MSFKVKKLEKSQVKITFEVGPERFEEGIRHSYQIMKRKVNIAGFRKGKAPRNIIEKLYGKEIFYEEAVNYVLPEAYESVISTIDLDFVSQPEFDIESVSVEDGVVLTATLTVKPEVTLGKYKALNVIEPKIEISENEIETELKAAQEKNSRLINITDRSVQDGDTVTIDYKGFVDGEAFEGGEAQDAELVIGSNSFIDTFEQQLIGHEVGDDIEINVTFPENYHSEELSGKPALFKVEVKDINLKELPVIDDEFAQDASEFDTLEEYKADIKAKLQYAKEHEAEHIIEEQLLDKLVEGAYIEVPEVMISTQIESMLQQFEQRIRTQGMSLEMFLQYTGMTRENLADSYRERAEYNVKCRLILEKVAEVEALEASEDDLNTEITKIAESYRLDEEKFRSIIGQKELEEIKKDIKVQKALDFVTENAIKSEGELPEKYHSNGQAPSNEIIQNIDEDDEE